MPPTVVITETLDAGCADWLGERCEVVWCGHDDPGFAEQLGRADALVVRTYTQVDEALLASAPNVRVIGRAGVGLDNFDLDACRRRGVRVVYTPDANTQAVVEYVFGLMLDHIRPRPSPGEADALSAASTPEQFHRLRKTQVGKQLSDLTLGIVGMGRIGTRMAALAHTLGMNTVACDVRPEAEVRETLPTVPFVFTDHADLFRRSDIVTLHTDGRPENRRMIGAEALADFRSDALFINAARGMLVDHDALADWLRKHADARAILDVHDPEPPASDSPLFALPNAWLLPHLASRTDTALRNMSEVVRDVAAVLDGKEPRYPAV